MAPPCESVVVIPEGPSVPLGRGDGPVRTLVDLPSDRSGVRDGWGATASEMAECLEQTHTDAFLVVQGGRLLAEWYAAPEVEHTPQALMSLTKSVLGCIAGVLAARGVLDVDAPAAAYVPELRAGGYAEASVRDVLDMRTGGDYREDYASPDGELAATTLALTSRDQATPGLRRLAAHSVRRAESRGPFAYRSLDTEVLGWVLERAAAEPLTVLLERLLEPLGLQAPGTMRVDVAGTPHCAGGLALTPRDVARFGLMLLDGGAVGETQVVPAAFLKDVRHGGEDSQAAFRAGLANRHLDAPRGSTTIYRSQFWVPSQGKRRLLCLGVHGQLLLVDPASDSVVVKLSSWPEPRDPPLFTRGLSYATRIVEELGGLPPDTPAMIA